MNSRVSRAEVAAFEDGADVPSPGCGSEVTSPRDAESERSGSMGDVMERGVASSPTLKPLMKQSTDISANVREPEMQLSEAEIKIAVAKIRRARATDEAEMRVSIDNDLRHSSLQIRTMGVVGIRLAGLLRDL